MLPILLMYLVVQGAGGKSSWECVALGGERVPNGEMFVPGPDRCTACKCEEGKARVCQAVLCQPPQDCKSFRLGKSCCDFICLDDLLPKLPDASSPSTDLGLRMVASAVTTILSLALLLFLIHRLRQRRLRAQQQYYEDQLDSPTGPNPDSCHNNACCHNVAYCSGNDHVDFFLDGHTPPYSLWKPPSFYFPHEDAPPPYSEVVESSYRTPQTNTSYPALGSVMVQLNSNSPAIESSENSGGSALAVIGAIGGGSRSSPYSSSQPSATRALSTGKHLNVALRSDNIYEDVDATPEDLPPPYCPSSESPGSYNQDAATIRATTSRQRHDDRVSEVDIQIEESVFGADDVVCASAGPEQLPGGSTSTSSRNKKREHHKPSDGAAPVRLRAKEGYSSAIQMEMRRSSLFEQFQLHLNNVEISDSSTSSDAPTRTFSSSSEDSTSMDVMS